MDHVYAAVFQPQEDGTYTITFPDLPGCISEGKNLGTRFAWLKALYPNELNI